MTDANSVRMDSRGASLILAGAMCLIPFLQPRHFLPIRTFYDEWLAFAFGLAALGLSVLSRKGTATRVPTLSLYLGLFSLTLALYALLRSSAYPQTALLWALYVLFAALLVILGQGYAMAFGRDRCCDLLAGFLLAGALLNAIAGVLQVAGIPPQIDSFISYLHGKRAIGNVGQSNLYANYLALGTASLIYLFVRQKIGLWPAVGAALLLLIGIALSASRTGMLYLGYLAALSLAAPRRDRLPVVEGLRGASLAMLFTGLLLLWLVPLLLNSAGFSIEGGFRRSVPAEWISTQDAATGLRILAWELAWKLFSGAPLFGVGAGEFPGAAFALGLPPAMANGEVWTSPHNLILQLLAETGLSGAVPVCVGLLIWLRRSTAEFLRLQDAAIWWVAACAGIGLLHAMLEYPFWYANFLAITALILGIGATGGLAVRPGVIRALIGGSAVAGGLVLASVLYDYVRFDLAISPSSGRSLASESEVRESRVTMRSLSHGLLAPRVELWLFLALPLDSHDLEEKLSIGRRVVRVWPSSHVVSHQAIFLALSGHNDEAVALITQGLKSSASQRARIFDYVAEAPSNARSVLQPVINATLPRPH